MKLNRGDVVIAVFPGELGKPRPAVILQSDDFTDIFTTVLSCPMTTHLIDAPLLRPIIVPDTGNGLQELSQIMVEKISPLRKDVVRQSIGKLSAGDMRRLETALVQVMGLAYRIPPTSEIRQQGNQP